MQYRPEVDGLRALAVVPVILFHAGIPAFSGGFVGVDVFFVISGYLITGLILGDLATGTFSIAKFYERRARRILPALFLVLLACIPVALLTLLPADTKDFSKALAAVSLFSSNVLFWRESGYFGPTAELNPLLHTWSLAVEEQFYLFFPLIVLTLWSKQTWRNAALLFTCAGLSFAAAQWGSSHKPVAAFFLLPTRAWELLIGAMVALYLREIRPTGQEATAMRLLPNAGSLLGLAMILAATLTFDSATPFPGVYALMPTVGTALVLIFATSGTFAERVLTNRVLVGIGLISYSAYLWHQPLFAFARHRQFDEPSVSMIYGLAIASLGLAYLTWRFVEAPFRNRERVSTQRVLGFAGLGSLFFLMAGLAGVQSEGFESQFIGRLTAAQTATLASLERRRPLHDDGDCKFSSSIAGPEFIERFEGCAQRFGQATVVLGDSHGMDIYDALSRQSSEPFFVGVVQAGCRPHTDSPGCQYQSFRSFAERHAQSIRHVIFSQAGFYLIEDRDGRPSGRALFRTHDKAVYSPHSPHIEGTGDYLVDLANAVPVIWLGPRIEPHLNITALFHASNTCSGAVPEIAAENIETFNKLDAAIKMFARNSPRLGYMSQMDAVQFDPHRDIYDCANVYWRDGDHWSAAGVERFGARINAALEHRLESVGLSQAPIL